MRKGKQYSRRQNLSQNYKENHSDLQARSRQPNQPLRGNYRVDAHGNPIIPQSNEELEQYEDDYFARTYSDNKANQQSNIYNLEDYYSHEDELVSRMRQPNKRNYVDHVNTSRGNIHRNISSSPSTRSNSRKRTNNTTGSKQKNWYYDVHSWLSQRKQSKPNAVLPSNRVVLFAVFSMIYLVMLLSGWQLMPFNKVNQIIVTGNEIVPAEFVAASSRLYPYDSMDAVASQRQEIEEQIKAENPLVESVAFNRSDWRVTEIAIQEHDIVAIINNDGESMAVLSNGNTLDTSSNYELAVIASENLPEVQNFNTSNLLNEIARSLRQIDPSILAMMDTINYIENPNKPNAIEIEMKDGNLIKAIMSTFSQKVQHYPEILSQLEGRKGIVNFEVGAYFTPNVSNANSIKLDDN